MNSLVKSLIQPLLEANQGGIALVPGGFKPPTLGHFYLVNQVAKHPEVNKVIVLIGHKTRDGVTKEESKAIWDIYQKYLSPNVEIKSSDSSSPISDVSSLIKNNPDTMFYPVVGIRGEMDLGDLKRFDSMEGKYDNFKPIVIKSDKNEDRISGTNTRAALIGGDKDRFLKYLPTELSNEDKEKVWSILQKTPLNEMYAEPSEHDYPKLIKSLTEYMLDKGMNIRPLPKVKFVDDDIENARNFFGKTAYYDPNNRVIVLYTMERHPKDVMRSFAHEMIHHMQNCDNRLGNIKTQNTNEEGDLPEIEREAYEKGNMTFRNWTDTLTEGVLRDRIECDNCDWSWPIKDGGDDLYVCHKCGHDNTPKQLNEGRYDKITNDISSAIFNKWKQDYENEVDASRFEQTFETDDLSIDVDANLTFIPDSGKLKIDGGADAETGYIEVRFEIDPEKLPEFWGEISMNLKDVIRHEIEHLTHGEGYNENPAKLLPDDQVIRDMIDADMLPKAAYFRLEKEIDANLQGMYLRAKKEKRPFRDVIDDYLDAQDITPEEKESILSLWRGRLKALNLPKF
jgi:phosphopantetheine adenylyltransferase